MHVYSLFLDSQGFNSRSSHLSVLMLRNMIERFGADHVMLGTDYPYDMAEVDPLGAISAVKRLNKSDRDMITGGNAKKLFKINSK